MTIEFSLAKDVASILWVMAMVALAPVIALGFVWGVGIFFELMNPQPDERDSQDDDE